jgi:hypothetical protein
MSQKPAFWEYRKAAYVGLWIVALVMATLAVFSAVYGAVREAGFFLALFFVALALGSKVIGDV